jgi:ribA/ribD-fused uncharacterized protein
MIMRDDYYFMSNMYPCKIKWKDNIYKSAETIFQLSKCKYAEDIPMFKNLNGFESKKLGRKIKMRNDWNDIKVLTMRKIVKDKFLQNPKLLDKLKRIKEPIIEENTWGDRFWGVSNGMGLNVLGKILTEVKDYEREYNEIYI